MEAANITENAAENLVAGEKAARHAVALKPNSPDALMALGGALTEQGRNLEALQGPAAGCGSRSQLRNRLGPDRSISITTPDCSTWPKNAYDRSVDLNPHHDSHSLDARPHASLSGTRRRNPNRKCGVILAANPDQFKALAYLGEFLYYQGKYDEAEKAADAAPSNWARQRRRSASRAGRVSLCLARSARQDRSRRVPYKPDQYVDGDGAYWMGGVYAMLGEKQQALTWLRRAVALGNHNYPWFQRDKNYTSLRNDPEYQKIMEEVRDHLDEYRKAIGSD